MQPPLPPTARIIAVAVLAGVVTLIALLVQRTASADPVDDLLSEAAIKAALSLDPYLSSLPVTVQVRDGRTTVSGKVGHPAQKRLAMRKVRSVVDGSAIVDEVSVVSVESGDRAEPAAPPDDATVPRRDFMDRWRRRADQSLKVRAHDALLAARSRRVLDRNIPDCSIQVEVRDGVVTLSGKVPEQEQSSLAEELVAGLSGVASVQNELVVED